MSGAQEYQKRFVGGKFIPEHLVVAAQMLGRELIEGEIVHHVNGNKRDNRAENLLVLPSREAHSAIAGIIGEFLEERGLVADLKKWYEETRRETATLQAQLRRARREKEKLMNKIRQSEKKKGDR